MLLHSGRASVSSQLTPVKQIDPAQLKESIMHLYFDGLYVRPEHREARS
jgi:hypothetical protein